MSIEISFRGINHLALVCADMARTVDFYQGVLGMPLTKTVALPDGGQHFFFDCGGGNQIAFFWFPNGAGPAPGIASPANRLDLGDSTTVPASMNHLAFDVAPDEIDECVDALRAAGIDCTDVVNHDDSPATVSADISEGTFVRSIYFMDPDGIMLELAAWHRPLTADDLRHEPRSATSTLAAD